MEQNKNIGFHWVKAITAGARVGFGEEWRTGAFVNYVCGTTL